MRVALLVGEEQAGARLDTLVADRPEVASRAVAQRLIERGRVTVDGAARPKRHRVGAGERVEIELEDEQAPATAVHVPFEILHEDEHLLVIDKPAGVVVHPGAGVRGGTLVDALRGRVAGGPDPERPGVVHRLDRDTSGLLLMARSEEVHRELQRMIREREVLREYLALVHGRPDAESGTIDAPIGRDRVRRTLVSTSTDRPREAVTHFRIEQALPRTTLLRVRLETGRTHQIRAHLAAIGHPVCGDPAYGGRACGQRVGLTRQFLHSDRLMFQHPVTREKTACESKLPAELRRAIDAAKREPVSGGPDGG